MEYSEAGLGGGVGEGLEDCLHLGGTGGGGVLSSMVIPAPKLQLFRGCRGSFQLKVIGGSGLA